MRAPKSRQPWMPAEYEEADAGAIQACLRGDASPDQQQRAIRWIILSAAQTYDQSFHPESARVTDFLEGRRSVGNQILKLSKLVIGRAKRGDA